MAHGASGCRAVALLALLIPALAAGAPAPRLDAAPPAAPGVSPPEELARPPTRSGGGEGRLLGPGTRWGEMPILKRVVWDIVAIPANADRWDARDWTMLGLGAVTLTALMAPLEPSVDVRVDHWAKSQQGRIPPVWNEVSEPILWSSVAVGALGTWGWAVANQRWYVAQGISLMGEALAVTQFYHLTLKLLIGREGPRDGSLEGRVLGPGQGLGHYPGGTPSGHSATIYSLMGASFAYFRPPAWLRVGAHVAVAGVFAFHVLQHRHYLSESLWGGVMGWSIGGWVVAHRSTELSAPAGRDRAQLVPVPLRDGLGIALVGRY